MKSLKDQFILNNGVGIPCIGFGTWQTHAGRVAVVSVLEALETGYRHIDTAAAYDNEESIGEAISKSGINRKNIFVTSKLWNSNRGYDTTLRAFDESLRKLGLDYLDLYLIHWPATKDDWRNQNNDTWRAFEKLYNEKRIRSIGVSNFKPHHLKPLMEKAEIMPAVNQIEFHPGLMQTETVEFCKKNNILIEAWSPLGSGRILNNPDLIKIAEKYNKSVAQLCIKWCLQNNVLPLPKSITIERIHENAKVFDFIISSQDMDRINMMPHIGSSGLDPDKINF